MGLLAKRGALVHLPHDKSRNDNREDSQCHCHTSTDVARLDLGYSIDVARLDLGCDGESWHRSKPLQRCKLKITGLCKLCIQGCIIVESYITPGIYANSLFRVVRL